MSAPPLSSELFLKTVWTRVQIDENNGASYVPVQGSNT